MRVPYFWRMTAAPGFRPKNTSFSSHNPSFLFENYTIYAVTLAFFANFSFRRFHLNLTLTSSQNNLNLGTFNPNMLSGGNFRHEMRSEIENKIKAVTSVFNPNMGAIKYQIIRMTA